MIYLLLFEGKTSTSRKGVAISLTRQALRALGRIKMTTRAMNIAGGTDDP